MSYISHTTARTGYERSVPGPGEHAAAPSANPSQFPAGSGRRSGRRRRRLERAMLFYVVLANLLIPSLTPLRATGTFETGYLLQIINPIAAVTFLAVIGLARSMRAHAKLQTVLALVVVQAAVVGLLNHNLSGNGRDYFAHIFQLSSAYVLFSVGYVASPDFRTRALKRMAVVGLVGFLLGTAVTVYLLGLPGVIQRFYGPSYSALLALCYSIGVAAIVPMIFLFACVFMANKRGMLIVSVALIPIALASGRLRVTSSRLLRILAAALLLLFVAIAFLPRNDQSIVRDSTDGPLLRAIKLSSVRVAESIEVTSDIEDLDATSAGRLSELEAVFRQVSLRTFAIGEGAGWAVLINGKGHVVNNIHLTPVSLTVVFGLPFAMLFYFIATRYVIRALRTAKAGKLTVTHRIMTLYVAGGLVYSLTAYSLFTDLLFFLFLGSIAAATDDARSSPGIVR
jgi:hypothetical protein